MSEKDKNNDINEGLAELMNTFGYSAKNDDVIDLVISAGPSADDEVAEVNSDVTVNDTDDGIYEFEADVPFAEEDELQLEISSDVSGMEEISAVSDIYEDAVDETVAEIETEPEIEKAVEEKPKEKIKKPKKVKEKPEDRKKIKEKPEKAKKVRENEEKTKETKPASPIKLVITLTVICAAVALLLAAVNHFTEPRIEENNQKAILDSIRNIFDEYVQAQEMEIPENTEFTSLYLVTKNGGVCGYSAAVSPAGFGGPINLMVGVDSAGAVVGVDVISMSETPGLGSKTGGTEFLSQFTGASGEIKVDAISGATISSNAVAEGVNSVTADLLDLAAIAAEKGMTVVPYVPGAVAETTTDAPAAETETVVPEAPVTTAPAETEEVIGAPDVSKNAYPPDVIVPNPGDGKSNINAEYVEDTTEFETLTTEPESSELESSAES